MRRVASDDGKLTSKIAVVGIGCRFPGLNGPSEFWDYLLKGFYIKRQPGNRELKISDTEKFDPKFFGMTKKDAARLDPQQRLALEVGYEALWDAGILKQNPSDRVSESNRTTGVFFCSWK